LGVVDKRGSSDIFGKEMKVTRWNLADNLASAANIMMGEGMESSPIAIIKDAPIALTDEDPSKLTQALSIDEMECLWAQFILNNY
jgi:F420-0:gamma-glutamyl ligase